MLKMLYIILKSAVKRRDTLFLINKRNDLITLRRGRYLA